MIPEWKHELLAAAARWLEGRTAFASITDVSLDQVAADSYGSYGLELTIDFTRSDGSRGWYTCEPKEGVDLWLAIMRGNDNERNQEHAPA